MSSADHLVYMANQIARNFGALADDAAATKVAEHILLYWDPRMKSRIVQCAKNEVSELSAVTAEAVRIVADKTTSNG
ncbi:formate dehydrogenase subunit delta [Parasphingorhabdus marina DSM 22363]|uniref:Formate dehydrogenase subunit delta n=1 Tax=Parasphingorhabdus marina DSM 22363 TaxID=1123272 RepID=A0A1N6D9Q3_9SPHN|nr:formate dehydrogenase subunit delta [Parasphingorhabdus marina]SIN67424.1 formate dehydrogenase subunit delta [Parasphingorhabdus marina DSM 22363]